MKKYILNLIFVAVVGYMTISLVNEQVRNMGEMGQKMSAEYSKK